MITSAFSFPGRRKKEEGRKVMHYKTARNCEKCQSALKMAKLNFVTFHSFLIPASPLRRRDIWSKFNFTRLYTIYLYLQIQPVKTGSSQINKS